MAVRLISVVARCIKCPSHIEHVRAITNLNSNPVASEDETTSLSASSKIKSSDDQPEPEMQNPFEKEKPMCILCKYDITPSYKNVKLLSQFISPFTGRIYGRQITRLCTTKQKIVEREIIKSRNSGLMPYYFKQPYFMKDPKLFDPENPLRHHGY